jgi:hypothetical protein
MIEGPGNSKTSGWSLWAETNSLSSNMDRISDLNFLHWVPLSPNLDTWYRIAVVQERSFVYLRT